MFANVIQDLRFAARQWKRQLGFIATAALLLGLGIGAATAAFSILYEIVLKPLPSPDPQQLVFVHNRFPKSQVAITGVSGFDYAEMRRDRATFQDAAVFYWNDLTLTGAGQARHNSARSPSLVARDYYGAHAYASTAPDRFFRHGKSF